MNIGSCTWPGFQLIKHHGGQILRNVPHWIAPLVDTTANAADFLEKDSPLHHAAIRRHFTLNKLMSTANKGSQLGSRAPSSCGLRSVRDSRRSHPEKRHSIPFIGRYHCINVHLWLHIKIYICERSVFLYGTRKHILIFLDASRYRTIKPIYDIHRYLTP